MKRLILVCLLFASPALAQPAHIGTGKPTVDRVREVVIGTAAEFPGLTSQGQNTDIEVELLRRMIWHLKLAGFEAGRQRNPSGAVSGDKLTAFADGQWRIWDVLSDTAKGAFSVHFDEIPNAANSVPDDGIADEPGTGGGGSTGGGVTDDDLHRILAAIEAQGAAMTAAISAHAQSSEAHWEEAKKTVTDYVVPVLKFLAERVLPIVVGGLIGVKVAQ